MVQRRQVSSSSNISVNMNQKIWNIFACVKSSTCSIITVKYSWDRYVEDEVSCVWVQNESNFKFKLKKQQTYLSKAIATRWSIDAVQQSTSLDVHISHNSGPSDHSRDTSYTAPRGITRQATNKSATANDKIKWFETLWRFRSSNIAAITKTFPIKKKQKYNCYYDIFFTRINKMWVPTITKPNHKLII